MKRLKKNTNKPRQYIQGWVEFYKLKFKVTPNVLIPRPETELLVDEVLKFIREYSLSKQKASRSVTILDIGTGTGNIAISLAKNLRLHPWGANVTIIATDISPKALKVAKQNAKFHGVLDKIDFYESDLLAGLPRHVPFWYMARNDGGINIIVTNLPYIPSNRIPYLDSSVKDYEPHVALDGGEDGFKLYRNLFKQMSLFNLLKFILIGEIDYTHGELAISEAYKYFSNSQAEVKTDLNHKQRILFIKSL